MESFRTHRGLIATLNRANIDTDQIIPKQFLKSIRRTGFGESLFYDWRYLADGSPNRDFALNQPQFKGASILVVGNNFGCGSSREHAVWAIQQAGFNVVAAPRIEKDGIARAAFADIFRNNAQKNALLTIELAEAEVGEIIDWVERQPGLKATANLEKQTFTLHLDEEISFHFDFDRAVKERLVQGLDDIALTLKDEEAIRAFESRHNTQFT